MKKWVKRLFDQGLNWAKTKNAWIAMFVCAFADASFFPLPTPIFFIGLALLNTKDTYRFALGGTLGTLTGAFFGYLIGHFAWLNPDGGFSGLAKFFFQYIPGFSIEIYNRIKDLYVQWDFWILFFAGYTPIPYKFFSISSGVFNLNLLMMLFATLIGQGIRFFILAFLIIRVGEKIKRLFETKIKLIALVSSMVIISVIVILKLI